MVTHIKLIAILICLLINISCFSQVNLKYNKFSGKWINTQYEQFSKQKKDDILQYISPQIIIIDSVGSCTVIYKLEQKITVGKPIKQRHFGNLITIVYKNKYEFYLSEIKNNNNLIALSFPNNSISIIFKKE